MATVPGQSKEADMPLLEHLVEKVADGATCMHQVAYKKNAHAGHFPGSGLAKAPAVSLAEHADALREETADAAEPPQLSTTGVLGCKRKHASRQYKRAVNRFGFALTLWSDFNLFSFWVGCSLGPGLVIYLLFQSWPWSHSGGLQHLTTCLKRMGWLWSYPTSSLPICWLFCLPQNLGYCWVALSLVQEPIQCWISSGSCTKPNMEPTKFTRWRLRTSSV